MGDGGVACMPLQHIMEKFPGSEAYCGGGGNVNGKLATKSSVKTTDTEMMKKLKKDSLLKTEKREFGFDKPNSSNYSGNHSNINNHIKNIRSGNTTTNKNNIGTETANGDSGPDKLLKDEVEEGELGTLKSPIREVSNGELEKPLRAGSEKGEVEKSEFYPRKWRRGEREKSIFNSGRLQSDTVFRRDHSPETGTANDEIEKGEFIPDRWHGRNFPRDEFDYSRPSRYDSGRDRNWRPNCDWTPPSGKCLFDGPSSGKDFGKGILPHPRRTARWEIAQERSYGKLSSKIVDEGSSRKNEHHDKNHGREQSSGSRLKRHANEPERHIYQQADYVSAKSRRLSGGDTCRSAAHTEHFSLRSAERSNRNFSSSRGGAQRHSGRHHDYSPSSKLLPERSLHERGGRHRDHKDRSPVHPNSPLTLQERSPRERGSRHREHRDCTPVHRERSPYDRVRHHDRRNRNPVSAELSSPGRGRARAGKDQFPSLVEQVSCAMAKPHGEQELSHNKETSETGLNFKPEEEDKSLDGDANINDQSFQSNESKEEGSVLDGLAAQFVTSKTEEIVPLSLDGSAEKTITPQIDKGDSTQLPGLKFEEKNEQANGFAEEPSSMEEDMDICDTPPHVPFAAEATVGKWYYLDHHGIERGPSRLCDLKALVEGGFLMSDHMVKYFGGDRWVTVENAASPPVSMNFSTVVSDAITQMVSPPEPTGNLLADLGDSEAILDHSSLDRPGGMEKLISHPDNVSDNHHIDDRVEALLGGVDVVPGKELEALGEVMRITFSSSEWETWANSQGLMPSQILAPAEQDGQDISKPESSKDAEAYPASANLDNDSTYHSSEFSEWFSVRWPCKGDDWCRNEDAALEWPFRKKVMLNDGYPLCQMAISGIEDPRSHRRDDLYYPAQSRKLDLPPWAFSLPEEKNDVNVTGQPGHPKPVLAKGVKGTVLPVVRINACVVRDRGSFVSDPRSRMRSKERQSLKSSRPSSSSSNDCRRSSAERALRSKSVEGGDSEGSSKATSSFDLPKDRLCTKEELQLHAGDWHYLDGAGREHGPYLYSELQGLVDRGLMLKDSSVFRKKDQLWVPITPSKGHHRRSVKLVEESKASAYDSSVDSQSGLVSSSFHSLHPQFIGYTRGKLHELVMRSYKIREFAAAINEVLDPWINAKQPKKETEKHLHIKAPTSDGDTYLAHENQIRGLKRARLTIDSSDEDHELTEHFATFLRDESSFDDVCESATFALNEVKCSKTEIDGWGLLDGHVLARIFHFLRADVKSMIVAGSTCRHWRASVGFYKDISRLVDLSIIGSNCTDQVIKSIMIGYNIEKVKALVLVDCANVTSGALEEIIGSFSHISCIDIRGCSQFDDLVSRYPHISWVKRRGKLNSQPKMKSLDQISGKASYVASASCVDDSVGLRAYFDRAEMKAFKPSMYRRNKLYDPRKSASISSRDAQMRRKSAIGFKRIEESVLLNLRNIMKDNTFEIFVPKVSEIEDRIKGGYYAGRGLTLIKEDIQRMCRDAVKNRGAAGDMDRIVAQFINLATSLQGSKLWTHRDEIMKKLRDDSTCNVMGKRRSKTLVDRKYSHRSNGASFPNGSSDFSEYSSDRELKNRLSKLNKKSWNYTNESSDESEFSAYSGSDSRLTDSDTQSDSDIRSDGVARGRQDDYLRVGGGFDLLADEREWGARMTKASLVPPVTRKYDVITEYLIVADEKEVRRKMRVSLPDDYEEKVKAQKSGTEETDMEIPEVKEFKPRKQPGDEVIEQEVYGIDPYTHNLILDSMPAVDGWSLHEKHQFVENVILRTLNKQVRDFTGSSNTPMTYPLRHVIHEIVETARAHGDMRTLGLCEPLLEAIDNRVEDKYVAYRKGLGVVCNKDGGIEKDDFVVEFLGEVYPAWKWYEKQDGIRSLQKNTKDPAPEFYNINLERPKGDADGYDLVVVDAMHKANYASRICHSCQPNCEAKVTAVDGHYQIGIYTVRPILFGEEITFDYNSVTESKEEYEASVCLCGSQVCRGSYLNLTGEGAFQKVLQEKHGLLDRHTLMLEACELNWVSEEDYLELGRAGLGSCLLDGLPDWLIAYSARLVRFINVERTLLPREIFKHNVDEKSKYFTEICLEVEKSDAEVQAEGVYNQRLQNLALTLDKVRYVLRCVFGDPKKAPPPLQKLSLEETISYLWKGDGSLVQDLLQSMAPHVESTDLETLKVDIRALDPSVSDDPEKELHKSLLWLRDKVRSLPCGVKSRHDAAADLIHVYAHTKSFFKIREYKSVTSPPVYISPLDLGPKYADKISGLTEYRKTYNKNYCLGQLIFWENQANADPDRTLARASRGCLALPDVGSFYAKPQKPSRSRIYGHKTVRFMVSRMVKQPQRPWPKDRIWEFKEFPRVLGSPMLDALLLNKDDPVVDSDMVRWLKNRPGIFHTSTDL